MGRIKKTRRFLVPDSGIAYSYSDASAVVEETINGVTCVKFLSSGTLTIKRDATIDVFLVGGGGGGGNDQGGGGGGGYTLTQKAVEIEAGDYQIVIGEGGASASTNAKYGSAGGETSAFGFQAAGGSGGGSYKTSKVRIGGAGGSGGGGGGTSGKDGGIGGENGEDGSIGSETYAGGAGQGSTTRAFGEDSGALYAGGGGGGCNESGTVGAGGEGGGADGGANDGEPNTGGGGGGGLISLTGGKGGSGIVIIRRAKS